MFKSKIETTNNNMVKVFLISGIIYQGRGKCNQPRPEAEADYTCRDLDYSGYHKNRIQLLFYYKLFYGKYAAKTIV